MKIMKILIFLSSLLLLLNSGCQKQEEEVMDIDEMVMAEDEMDAKHLTGDPLSTPQEVLIQEPE